MYILSFKTNRSLTKMHGSLEFITHKLQNFLELNSDYSLLLPSYRKITGYHITVLSGKRFT